MTWTASALTPLRELYESTLTRDFGPFALEVIRNEFVAAGYCRTAVNARVDRIRRCLRGACSRGLLPVALHLLDVCA